MDKALVEDSKNDVHRYQRQQDEQRFARQRLLKSLCRSLEAAMHVRGHANLRACIFYRRSRIAQA